MMVSVARNGCETIRCADELIDGSQEALLKTDALGAVVHGSEDRRSHPLKYRLHSAFLVARRAFAACWAIAFLTSGTNFGARASPPFESPNLPITKAAGFITFTGAWNSKILSISAVVCTAMVGAYHAWLLGAIQ